MRAPFEAEWQCVCLERMNLVDAVMSSDGDCITHGASKSHHGWNFVKRTFLFHDKDVESMNALGNPIFKHNENHWCVVGAMLGCDCLNRVHNCGCATLFNKVFPNLVMWEMLEIKKVLEKETRFKLTDEHMKRLEQTINLFLCPHVVNDNDEIVPMKKIKDGVEWGKHRF